MARKDWLKIRSDLGAAMSHASDAIEMMVVAEAEVSGRVRGSRTEMNLACMIAIDIVSVETRDLLEQYKAAFAAQPSRKGMRYADIAKLMWKIFRALQSECRAVDQRIAKASAPAAAPWKT